MKLAPARAELNVLLVRARALRTDLLADLDAVDDHVAANGPYKVDGANNEEMRQLLSGAKADAELLIDLLRRLQLNVERLDEVRGRYDTAGLSHPVKA